MNKIILFILIPVFIPIFLGVLWFLFMCAVNYFYELSHFKVDKNGKLEVYYVWWGKYFGYK
jgi:hypothetical protein